MRLKESEIIERLQQEIDKYAPLTIKSIKREIPLTEGLRADAIIEFRIVDGPCFKALAEVKNVATPKTISLTVNQLAVIKGRGNDKEMVPLIIVPYMSTQQSKVLQREGISWIDLSGNMVIRAPSGIYIERTGKKNLFPDTSPIKKVFEGTSSLVSRALLLKKGPFRSLYEVVDFINARGGTITLATVSKVLRSLEEELLVTKSDAGITVTKLEKLLESLVEGYTNYTKRYKDKTYTFAVDAVTYDFDIIFYGGGEKVDYAMCGFYAAKCKGLATTDRITIFVKSINGAKKVFERSLVTIKPDAEFGQLDLIETKNPCVWFNLQKERDYSIVDDIELYLEMMVDTPRGPKVAEKLKERILNGQNSG
jgi:arginine repressor